MRRSRRHLLIALLLPLLALRALLPAGFMPTADADGLRLVMCSDGLVPATNDHDEGAPGLAWDAGDCPFALSALLAPAVEPASGSLIPFLMFLDAAPAATTLPPATGPPRQTTARGPPRSA